MQLFQTLEYFDTLISIDYSKQTNKILKIKYVYFSDMRRK